MKSVDILIIGGGSAGLAAAASAYDNGSRDILILERADYLGGILPQCIHNGFGLHRYHKELTGPEYASLSIAEITQRKINYKLHTFVLEISPEKVVTAVNPDDGLFQIAAKAIILAMGCRERARGALMIPGTRPAGVLTAGTAQRYLNLQGYLPGKEVVILGSGDIGLIMARQLTMEGILVKEVVELMPYSSGLQRNISQCLDDFGIPLSLSSTITEIRGKDRVSGVVIAKVDSNKKPIANTEREISCDTLLISAGLIPENELSKAVGLQLSPSTKGAVVDDSLQTSLPGIFACGNVLHVHDLVDHVSAEGEQAGKSASEYVQNEGLPTSPLLPVSEGHGISAMIPQYVRKNAHEKTVQFTFRPRNRFTNTFVHVTADGNSIAEKHFSILTPGESCTVTAMRKELCTAHEICIRVADAES